MLRLLPLTLLPALCLAQGPDAVTSQKVLEELKGIRASMERLEKGQKALLALVRIQSDGSQVVALEAQRQRLAAQEGDLSKEIASATRVLSAPPPMMQNPDGTSQPAVQPDRGQTKTSLEQASSALAEVRQARKTIDREIARLREHIAEMEKSVAEALK